MKYSNVLKKMYGELVTAHTFECSAMDQYGGTVDAWDPAARAWSTIGLLEREYYTPETGKYDKAYYPVIKLLQGTETTHYPDDDTAEHGRWWGAIWTALADES